MVTITAAAVAWVAWAEWAAWVAWVAWVAWTSDPTQNLLHKLFHTRSNS